MGYETQGPSVMPVESLRDWFRRSITAALASQQVVADAHTEHYIVNLLTAYARAENLYEWTREGYGLKPLAVMLGEALEAPRGEQRELALQRLGDVSLFIAGFFSDSLARKLVDVDYYARMGETAYGALSDSVAHSVRLQALSDVFSELARKFTDFIDVLSEVAQSSRVFTEEDVLRLYDIWVRTGSRRAARLLRGLGVEPAFGSVSRREH
ncbi:MAG TPA: hypothetical protein VNL72_04360 [Gammaproteobacteria bacterium]|nr:hypothetical protein [Gammaproteobacteria bacterium]